MEHQENAVPTDLKTARELSYKSVKSKGKKGETQIAAEPVDPMVPQNRKEGEEKSKGKEKSTRSETNLALGEKPSRIPANDIQFNGPLRFANTVLVVSPMKTSRPGRARMGPSGPMRFVARIERNLRQTLC
ncbi:hypothetical protein PFISCL1PPCAC_9106, partial [Pristionchus fissidentatus]